MNNNDIFAMYMNSLNQQTQALQNGFNQWIQQSQITPVQQEQSIDVNAMVQQQVSALMPQLMKQASDAVSTVSEVPAPVLPVQPVVEDVVERPEHPEYMLGNQQYDLYLRIDKPCEQCPFASSCELKASHIGQECGVMSMKEATVAAGEIHIEIKMNEQTMKTTYLAYKDGSFIGVLADNKENKTIRSELEKYVGHTVRLLTHLKKNVAHSTFTGLYAEILGTVEQVQEQPAQPMFDETIAIPEAGYPEPPTQPEEITLDLGEMVLPI